MGITHHGITTARWPRPVAVLLPCSDWGTEELYGPSPYSCSVIEHHIYCHSFFPTSDLNKNYEYDFIPRDAFVISKRNAIHYLVGQQKNKQQASHRQDREIAMP